LFVSIDFPGPTKSSHQPAFEDVADDTSFPFDATWEEADRPVWRIIAFDRSAFRVPHVSYAISYLGNGLLEYSRGSGFGHCQCSVAGGGCSSVSLCLL